VTAFTPKFGRVVRSVNLPWQPCWACWRTIARRTQSLSTCPEPTARNRSRGSDVLFATGARRPRAVGRAIGL